MKNQTIISITKGTFAEIKEWSNLRMRLWPESSRIKHEREMFEYFKSPKIGRVFFAHRGQDKYIGFAEISMTIAFQEEPEGSIAHIEGLYVLPKFRKMGVATKLVESLETWSLSEKCRVITSDMDVENIESRDLHTQMGYKEVEKVIRVKKYL